MRVRRMLAVLVAAVALLGTTVMAGSAGAGDAPVPTAEAFATCVEGEGFINVGITDESQEIFDIFIDGELVANEVSDSDGGFYTFGPYANGLHNIVVEWLFDGPLVILDVDELVECEGQPTTVPTTEAPSTTAEPSAAAATQPRFTG